MEEEEEQQYEEGMTFDELSLRSSREFLNALQELKNLRPQLYYAADYCEKSFLHNQQKKKVLENSKEYAVKALVNAVDHLGNVASQLNGLLSQETTEIAATEVQINCLKQRLLTCKEYTDGKALRQQCLGQTFPRYHRHYCIPGTGTGDKEAGSGKESYIGLDSERARLQPLHLGETQTASTLKSNPPFSNEVHFFSSASASACQTFVQPEVRASIPSTPISRSQSAAGTPRSSISSISYGAEWKDRSKSLKKDPIEGAKSSFSLGNNHKRDVRQPPHSKGFLSSLFHGRKSAKRRPDHVP